MQPTTPTAPNGIFPDQAVEEYTDDDYKKSLQFLASRWNIQNTYWMGSAYLDGNGAATNGTAQMPYMQGFAYNYVRNVNYIYGNQTLSPFGFFNKDDVGNTIVPIVRGRDITKHFNIVNGNLRDLIEPLPKMMNVTAFSPLAQSEKTFMLEAIKKKAENYAFLKEVEYMTGVGFTPSDDNFEDDYAIETKVQNFQESMEVAYQALGKNAIMTNNYLNTLVKGGDYMFIGGMAMMEVYSEFGQIHWRLIKPECAVFDMSKGQDQHDDDDYSGEIFQMPINECLSAEKWSEEEIKELKALSTTSSSWPMYNSAYLLNGLRWWSYQNGVPMICAVRGQWRSLEKQEDGTYKQVLREGILYGDKFLKQQKISEGQVWDKHSKGRKRLKYFTVTPNTLLGSLYSIVDMVKHFQDLKDALATKMIQLVASSIGKSYFIMADKLPPTMRTPDFIAQLKQSRIAVLTGADIDDETNGEEFKGLMNPVDLSIDPGVQYLLELVKYYDYSISDILNTPDSARGQLGTYQSKDVVSSNIAQSNKGMKWFYGNHIEWAKRIIEYSADLAKLTFPETMEGRDKLALIVGDADVQMFDSETIKKMQFEDFLLALSPNDIVTEQQKARYLQIAMQMATSGAITMSDYIKLDTLQNISEIENYFEAADVKKAREAKAAQMAQMQAAAQNTERTSQAQENIASQQSQAKLQDTVIKEDAANQRHALTIEADMSKPH